MLKNFERNVVVGMVVLFPIIIIVGLVFAVIYAFKALLVAVLGVAAFIGFLWFLGWVFGGSDARE